MLLETLVRNLSGREAVGKLLQRFITGETRPVLSGHAQHSYQGTLQKQGEPEEGRSECRGRWSSDKGCPLDIWTHTSWDCLRKTKQDLTHQHSILDGREARGATPLPEEPLAVNGCQGNGDIFFGGIAT